jgi:hypothetical protein
MLNRIFWLINKKDYRQPPTKGIDHWLAMAGLTLGLLAAVLSASGHGSLVMMGICIAITSGVYLLIKKRGIQAVPKNPKGIFKCLSIIFFLLVSLALTYSPDTQTGTLNVGFYLFIAAAYTVIAIEIVLLKSNLELKQSICILFQLILVSVALRIVIYGQFPSILGTDPWVNLAMVNEMIRVGNIPTEFVYADVPMFPLGLLCTQVITDMGYKSSLFLFGGIAELGTLVLLFIVGRGLTNAKTALLACLLLSFYPSFVGFGTHSIIAMSMGITLICLLLLLLTLLSSTHPGRTKILIIFCLFSLVMTHVIASIIALILLASFFIARLMKDRQTDGVLKNPVTSSMMLLVIVLVMSYWMWVSGFLGYVVESLEYAIDIAQGDFIAPQVHLKNYNEIEYYINEIINLVMLSFVTLTILVLSKKINRTGKWGIILFVIFGFSVMETSNIIGFDAILPDRWMPFIFIGAAILFAFSLMNASDKAKKIGKFIPAVLVAILCISMILSPTANVDSPVVDSTFRYGFQTSEMVGSDFALDKSNGDISTDYQLAYTYYGYGIGINVTAFESSYFNTSSIASMGTMLVRNYCLNNYFFVSPGTSDMIGYIDVQVVDGRSFNRTILFETNVIYSSPTLTIHTI